jgi:carboxyl-terminal processing protease
MMNRRFHYAVVASSAAIVGALLFGTVVVRSASPDDNPYTQLGVFSDVLTKIKVEYVEEPDLKAVTVGAVTGLLESLDPFASYLTAQQFQQYQNEHGKGKADVGLLLSRGPGYLRIVDALPGSAADQAKLSTGDVLESINKISTRDMPLAFAELLLQGDAGTEVEVAALTSRQAEPLTLKLKRAPIAYPAVASKMMAGKTSPQTGVITVAALLPGAAKTIGQKAQDLEKQGAKRLILDLRWNAVGEIEEGVATADLFMESGIITYTQGQRSRRTDTLATPEVVSKLPLIVLTNRGTAGAAEVAAAALHDSKRAKLVGEPTFGNAAVRKPITLNDGSAVIMASAKYYGPNGKAIQDTHVTPDVLKPQYDATQLVDDDGDGKPETNKAPQPVGPDLILNEALDQK